MALTLELPKDDIAFFFAALSVVTAATGGGGGAESLHAALEEYRMASTNLPPQRDRIAAARRRLESELDSAGLLDAARSRGAPPAVPGERRGSGGGGVPSWREKSCYVQTQMHLVTTGLYCGSYHPANDRAVLQSGGVTHICCCIGVSPRFPGEFQYHVIAADDSPSYDMSQHFPEACAFIDGALRTGGKVLVHCGAGISRAPTVLSAYLIQTMGLSSHAAVQLVREARPCASPNSGFMRQLFEWSKQTRREQRREGAPPPAVTDKPQQQGGLAGDGR